MSQNREQASALIVNDLHLAYQAEAGVLPVLRGLSFDLGRSEIGCLLGESGCGKTTAMRAIAGFVDPQRGSVVIEGREVAGPAISTPPEDRSVGVVFQDYALFPHLNVARNVGFGLRALAEEERRERIDEMLALVGLADSAQRYPHELSGGQQQRVALARALAPRPKVLLLDEPFSNLDPDLRERLALEVRDLLKVTGTTALLVTHDQYEAFAMADRIGVMEGGRIVQWDTAYQLYHRPQSRSVADFIGQGSFVTGEILNEGGATLLAFEIGRMPVPGRSDRSLATAQADAHNRVEVLLRPDDVVYDETSEIRAEVIRKSFRGAAFLYTLRLPSGRTLLALVPSHHDHQIGAHIGIRFAAEHVVTFPLDDS
ncbi:MAG: ABC transporter ATP-binding protein [Burkholderiaceae bacterium]